MKQAYLFITILLITSCKSNNSESIQHSKDDGPTVKQLDKAEKVDLIHEEPIIDKAEPIDALPIHGEMNDSLVQKYYPGITDTIIDLRIKASDKIEINPGKGIIVSMFYNSGTFEQMFLCTHNTELKLIDNIYIGKATMFDITSHTIEFDIVDSNTMSFDHVDWGYVEKKIDTIGSKSYNISISEQGKMRRIIR